MEPQQMMIRCPKTGKPFETGLVMDLASYLTSHMENNTSMCPHCGESHAWSKDNIFFEDMSPN
ncbi:MAG: hypothetical protein HZB25_12550 [Candidatus Eisenbacteria bacterium]|nr:hypothetical protein [Candidatus Eisenbacteria bacterium]